ncbi:MAG: tetratricopeptide repeat protein, partial [Bacteroidota bacterium]
MKALTITLFLIWSTALEALAQNQAIVDSLLNTLEGNLAPKQEVDNYVQIAKEYARIDSATTVKYANMAVKIAEEQKYHEGKVDALRYIGITNTNMGNYETAENILSESISLSKQHEYLSGEAWGYNRSGVINWLKGEFEEAKQHYKKSLKIFKEIGEQRGLASSLNNLSIIHEIEGNYPKALDGYLQSLSTYKKIGDLNGMSTAYINVGIIYQLKGDYQKAASYYSESLELAKKLGDKYNMVRSYGSMGNIFALQEDHSKALKYFFKSLEIEEKMGQKKSISTNYGNIANVYIEQGKYELALEYYFKSLEIEQELEGNVDTFYPLLGISDVYLRSGEAEKARKYAQEAIDVAQEAGMINYLGDAFELLALAEKELKNYQSAYEAQVRFKEIADSIQGEAKNEEIARLEVQYEFQQEKDSINYANQNQRILFEKEIQERKQVQTFTLVALLMSATLLVTLLLFFRSKSQTNKLLSQKADELRQANDDLATQRDELEGLNTVKDRVFSIIAHDLRSPINSLKGLLDIMSLEGQLSQEESQKLVQRISQSTQGVSGLLDNLLHWARIQMQLDSRISP